MTILDLGTMHKFAMKGLPLLSDGRKGSMLAITDQLNVQSRIYAAGGGSGDLRRQGGETRLHQHEHEDHFFFVLAGEATFYDSNDEGIVVQTYEGIMIPRGTHYYFKDTTNDPGDGNLVVMRVGGGTPKDWPSDWAPGMEAVLAERQGNGTPSGRLFGE